MGVRRNLIRLSSMVLLLLGFLLVLATPASASPMIPGVPDCKDAPMAQLPGDGITGFLDSKPNPLPPQGDPFVKNPTTSVYEQYGYAGLTWHTYDLGCGGDIRDVNASSDTMIGNATLAFATWGVAATNGLHNKIARPAEYMAPLDDVVVVDHQHPQAAPVLLVHLLFGGRERHQPSTHGTTRRTCQALGPRGPNSSTPPA